MGIPYDPAISKFPLQVAALEKFFHLYTIIQYIFIAALLIIIKNIWVLLVLLSG